MDNREYILSLIEKSRKAQEVFATYDQEKTDEVVRAIGKVIYDNAEMLSKMAIEDTGMGTLEGKISKHKAIATWWNYMKGRKSVGVIDNDPINGIVTIAKPMGVVASIMPSSNPTFTPCGNAMKALKGRNSVICAPHPSSPNSSKKAVDLMREELRKLGAPEDLIQVVENCNVHLSAILMEEADVVIATGGAGIVKAAYSSGTPAYGVGQGNVQVVLDKDYDDIDLLVSNVVANRPYDNGLPCTGEQCLFLPRERKDEVIKKFEEAKAFHISDPATIDLIRTQFFKGGILNRDIVGQTPQRIAEYLGIEIPEDTTMFLLKLEKYGEEEPLCREILGPVSRYIVYDDFEDAVQGAKENLLVEGAGHSADIYSNNQQMVEYYAEHMPVCRILVNQKGSAAGGNTYNNGFPPTDAVGGGTWGKNSLSENLTYKHLLNYTRIAYLIPGEPPTYEETWNSKPNTLATIKM